MCRMEAKNEVDRTINWDEINNYLDCRYVSSMEACWRLFQFKMSDRSHSGVCLPVHLEVDHRVRRGRVRGADFATRHHR